MFNVILAGGHLYGKQLFTWLSLVVSLMASFVLSFFPLDVLDGIWDLIESVSEEFLTYSFLGRAYRGLTGEFLLLWNFSVAISVSPLVCFILVLILMFLRECIYEVGIFHANRTTKCLRNLGTAKGEGWSTTD